MKNEVKDRLEEIEFRCSQSEQAAKDRKVREFLAKKYLSPTLYHWWKTRDLR